MANRKFDNCIEELQNKYILFKTKMIETGIDFIVTCTTRTETEQKELYAQGRTKPGKIVTWTLKSKHIEGKAFDICLLKNGKLNWNVSDLDWQKAGLIGESVGLKWGGRFKNKDFPHFETT